MEKPDWKILKEIREREEKETLEAANRISKKDEESIMSQENGAIKDILRRNKKQKRKVTGNDGIEMMEQSQLPKKKRRKLDKLEDWGEELLPSVKEIETWLHG